MLSISTSSTHQLYQRPPAHESRRANNVRHIILPIIHACYRVCLVVHVGLCCIPALLLHHSAQLML